MIAVAGAAFNPADAKFRSGAARGVLPLELPFTLGVDVSGTVAAIGPDVAGWSVGDSVIALLPNTTGGAQAEFVLANATELVSAPTGTRITLASALSTPGLTAWQALFEHARLTAGQHLLIHGASGAVGSFAIQLAKSADATVTATSSARNLDAVAALGADEAYDYNGPTPTGLRVQRFDVVLNLAPTDPAAMAALLTLLHDRGTLVSTVAPPPADARINGIRMTAHADTKQLDALAARVAAGTLIVTVARVVGLVDVARVHHDYETGHLRGKTVFDAVLAR